MASKRPPNGPKRPPKGLSWALRAPPGGLPSPLEPPESLVFYEVFVLRRHLGPTSTTLSQLKPRAGFQGALKRPQQAPKGRFPSFPTLKSLMTFHFCPIQAQNFQKPLISCFSKLENSKRLSFLVFRRERAREGYIYIYIYI